MNLHKQIRSALDLNGLDDVEVEIRTSTLGPTVVLTNRRGECRGEFFAANSTDEFIARSVVNQWKGFGLEESH